jgi:DDE superfamily endonuclease
VAATQIKEVLRRRPADGRVPLFAFDAGYDPMQLALDLREQEASVALLVRRRKNRCFYADPAPAAASRGRPRRHGHKFACADPSTWPAPSAEYTTEDAQ